ncbi:Uma2 family endonuclease [Pullulanibacillus sp. KACC 23026]|uniref:Uma2 family endonuclease n=1 Tax=Pullulanibacillus sp. KACC 23026 TaxID=3028315 RepID=UPI0023AF540B|nr:Uma2 family endonuclease [Pullulanibacillus sp. KACC 23026]WEG12885.1 Uma2 family endonuclease [Pullulanibacillus sp. KACC 23026]
MLRRRARTSGQVIQSTYDYESKYDDPKDDEIQFEQAGQRVSSPPVRHQLVCKQIGDSLSKRCQEDFVLFYSPIDLIFSEEVIVQPDLLLISRQRFPSIVRNRGIIGPPDLVVEVLSATSVKTDKVDKLHTYAYHGIPEYWIVDPNYQSLEKYVLEGESYGFPVLFTRDERVDSSTIPSAGFSMNEIFDDLLEIPGDDHF